MPSTTLQVRSLRLGRFHVPLTLHQLPGQHPLALVLPALGVPAAKYERLLRELTDMGYHAAICEMPGTGDSQPRPGRGADYGYNELVFEWLPQALRELHATLGCGPEMILGHSIGGQTLTLAARAGLTGDAQVVSIASGHLDSRSWRGLKRAAVVGAAIAAHTSTRLLGFFPGRQLRFGGREAPTLMRDWGTGIIHGRFAPEARIHHAAPLKRRPLYLCIANDPFAPINATRRLADLVGGEVHEIRSSHPHGNPHLSWIKNPRPVLEEIRQWCRQNAT